MIWTSVHWWMQCLWVDYIYITSSFLYFISFGCWLILLPFCCHPRVFFMFLCLFNQSLVLVMQVVMSLSNKRKWWHYKKQDISRRKCLEPVWITNKAEKSIWEGMQVSTFYMKEAHYQDGEYIFYLEITLTHEFWGKDSN